MRSKTFSLCLLRLRPWIKISLYLFLGIFLLFPRLIFAQAKTTRIHLDEATIKKGYTVQSDKGDFLVGIRPNVFQEELTVKLENLDNPPAELPKGKQAVSNFYLYDIQMSEPRVLEKPIVLALKYESDTIYKKEIHFWNRTTQSWQRIPSTIDYKNKYVRAFIHFPYSQIAVFEDRNSIAGPTKITNSWGVELDARAAIVVDDKSGKILFEKNANQRLPLASLTKIMTAVIFLETNPDFDREVEIIAADNAPGARLYLTPGDRVRVGDLFFASLVGSKNNATKALARATGLTRAEFVRRMNQKASELGLTNTHFVEVTGLDYRNQSSALDYARLSLYALRKMRMLQGTTTKRYSFKTLNTNKLLSFNNTNKLVNSTLYLTGGKTGHLPPSWGGINYSLMTKAKNSSGDEVIAVVLGNNSSKDVFNEVESLIRWSFANYKWE